MAQIESLTPEQEAQLVVYREKWIQIGLATDRSDRKKAEEAIHKCYAVANFVLPKKILWSPSPFTQALSRAFLAAVEANPGLQKQIEDAFDAARMEK